MLPIQIKVRVQALALAAAMLFAARPAVCRGAALDDAIQLTPASLTNGAPFLITVTLNDEASPVTGQWQGHLVLFFSGGNRHVWFALPGVDVEVAPGNYPLTVAATLKDNTHRTLH